MNIQIPLLKTAPWQGQKLALALALAFTVISSCKEESPVDVWQPGDTDTANSTDPYNDSDENTDSNEAADTETQTDSETQTESDADSCPNDPDKTEPGQCGCGAAEGTCDVEIPDPLPDPDETPPDTTKPVKIYILSGQSNMVGMGNISPEGTPGTLETIVKTEKKFPHMVDDNGNWTVRNDVWYKGVVTATANKWLTVGCGSGAGTIGPEMQFGHIMGWYHDQPVIVLKASQGNRSLAWDILPPGSERYTVDGVTYAGYGDEDSSWSDTDPYTPVDWYAGKQYDDFVTEIHKVLDNFSTLFPDYKDQGYEIAGFVWFQGHKDTGNAVHASRYEFNLVNFINSFRAEFNVPKAPFVIATIGFNGWEMSGNTLTVAEAQLAVSGETGNYPEFAGNVLTMDTRDFWRDVSISPVDQGYHYNRNAETYILVGDALARGMLKLIPHWN